MALRLGDLEQAEAEYLKLRERTDLSPYLSQVLEAKLLQAQRGLAAAKAPQPLTVSKPNPLFVCLAGSPSKLTQCLEGPGSAKEEAASANATTATTAVPPPSKAAPPPSKATRAAPTPRTQPPGLEPPPPSTSSGLPASLFLACAVLLLAIAIALFSEEIDVALGGQLGQLQQSGGQLLVEGRGRLGRALVTGRERLIAPFVFFV